MIQLIKKLNERQALVKENSSYYLVSQSRKFEVPQNDFFTYKLIPPEPEVLVFPCDSEGRVSEWAEVNGERGTTLEKYLPKLLSSGKVNLYD